jgi:hypothetical protein
VPLGSLGFTMVHQSHRRSLGLRGAPPVPGEQRTLPLMPLVSLPIAFGVHELYTWTSRRPRSPTRGARARRAQGLVPERRRFYLRAAICFAVWIGLSWMLNRLADRLDRDRSRSTDFTIARDLRAGIIAYVVAMTVAGVDWVMSLEPTGSRRMYGVLFVVSQGLMTLAFTIIIAAWIARQHVARDWLKARELPRTSAS